MKTLIAVVLLTLAFLAGVSTHKPTVVPAQHRDSDASLFFYQYHTCLAAFNQDDGYFRPNDQNMVYCEKSANDYVRITREEGK